MKCRRTTLVAMIVIVATAALAAAPLTGAGASPAGKRLLAFGLSFDGIYKHGKPVKVRNFVYSNLALQCNEGQTTYSPSAKFKPMDVNRKRRFKGTLKVDGMTSKVVGRYKRNLSKIAGTLKATGSFEGKTGCTSGEVRWVAE